MSGIETYAEQVAVAAATVGHETTLIVTTDVVAHAVSERLANLEKLRVVSAGIKRRTTALALADRLVPDLHTRRVGEAFEKAIAAEATSYDVIHLNRPGLAPWAEWMGGQLFVAGWFFPHAAGPRLLETWRHSRGFLPRRAVIAAKSLSYYAGDQRGYRAATTVVACTETLASQLRSQGIRAVSCPPPVRVPKRATEGEMPPEDGSLRLLVCSGDLSHPRKNLRHAVQAAARLSGPGRPVQLRAIGNNPQALEAEARRCVAAGARLQLVCLGVLQPADVHREMRCAHVLLLPSLYEEWGYVAIESILSGTPVASYPVYPFADMLQGGVGVVADALTPGALADAAARCLDLARGEALERVGDERFASHTLGLRLTQIWLDAGAGARLQATQRARASEASAVVPVEAKAENAERPSAMARSRKALHVRR